MPKKALSKESIDAAIVLNRWQKKLVLYTDGELREIQDWRNNTSRDRCFKTGDVINITNIDEKEFNGNMYKFSRSSKLLRVNLQYILEQQDTIMCQSERHIVLSSNGTLIKHKEDNIYIINNMQVRFPGAREYFGTFNPTAEQLTWFLKNFVWCCLLYKINDEWVVDGIVCDLDAEVSKLGKKILLNPSKKWYVLDVLYVMT